MSEITMVYVVSAIQIILAAGLINVWLVRFNKKTKYRGKGAGDMQAEFRAYGLPKWFMYLVGFAKIAIAGLLVAGLWYPFVVETTLYVLLALMVGAVSMHIKVRDPFVRSLPALGMMALCVTALVLM
jgi:hypothetical protein